MAREMASKDARVTLYMRGERKRWEPAAYFGEGDNEVWARERSLWLEGRQRAQESAARRRKKQVEEGETRRAAAAIDEALLRAATGEVAPSLSSYEQLHQLAERAAGRAARAPVVGAVRSRGKYSSSPR